jgi:hypothetical protein
MIGCGWRGVVKKTTSEDVWGAKKIIYEVWFWGAYPFLFQALKLIYAV